jgi:hypothetical protein
MSVRQQRDSSFIRPAFCLPNGLRPAARLTGVRTFFRYCPKMLSRCGDLPPAAGRNIVTTEILSDQNFRVTSCSPVSKLGQPAKCP